MAELDLEAGGGLQVEAEHPVVVVTSEPVRDRQLRVPRPVERGADVVAGVRLEHHVVEALRELERCARQRHRVVPGVAVEEPDLEVDPGSQLGLEPVGLREPEAVGEEADRLVEGRRGEHDVPEPDALGEEAARHQR